MRWLLRLMRGETLDYAAKVLHDECPFCDDYGAGSDGDLLPVERRENAWLASHRA
jgi:hypothetical protein